MGCSFSLTLISIQPLENNGCFGRLQACNGHAWPTMLLCRSCSLHKSCLIARHEPQSFCCLQASHGNPDHCTHCLFLKEKIKNSSFGIQELFFDIFDCIHCVYKILFDICFLILFSFSVKKFTNCCDLSQGNN